MNSQTPNEAWETFNKVVLSHPQVSDAQRKDMRKAFLGGYAVALATLAMTILLPKEEGDKLMDTIESELEAFSNEIRQEASAYQSRN